MSIERRIVVGLALALVLAGCGSHPGRSLSAKGSRYASLPNGRDPLAPERFAPYYTTLVGPGDDNLIRSLERKRGHALNVLSLSGGGQNGAFGAGFLMGWREGGRRPEFDVVGGVSTGALMATHAFLGTPDDDLKLRDIYLGVTKKDIYQSRGIFKLISGTDSLSDTAPLKALIARVITPETLARVAVAHDQGRLLLVGTTNVDYGQTWVWNMTLIAKEGNLDLYRTVLLASASFPIVFPPVEIEGHLFVDGAARSNVVVGGLGGDARPAPPLHGPGNMYLLDNGRLTYPPEALRRVLGEVAATTVGVMMDQSMQTALARSYIGAQIVGYRFHMAAIPDQVGIGKDPLAFDPAQMQAAFDAGFALGKRENPWSSTPPNIGDVPTWVLKAVEGPR